MDLNVDEVRATREASATRFNYELTEIFKDLKVKAQANGRNIASLPAGGTSDRYAGCELKRALSP